MRPEQDGDRAALRWAGESGEAATAVPEVAADRPSDGMLRLWIPLPVAIALGIAAVAAGAVLVSQGVPGSALALAFFLLAPGLALVRLLGLHDPPLEAVLSVSLSLALAGIIATCQAYLGEWSPAVTLAILVAVTIGALLARPVWVIVPRMLPRLTSWVGSVGTITRPVGRAAGHAAAGMVGPVRTTAGAWLLRVAARAGEIPARVRSVDVTSREETVMAADAIQERLARLVDAAPPAVRAAPRASLEPLRSELAGAVVSAPRIVAATPRAIVSTRRAVRRTAHTADAEVRTQPTRPVEAAAKPVDRTEAVGPGQKIESRPTRGTPAAGPRRKAPTAGRTPPAEQARPARGKPRAGVEARPPIDKPSDRVALPKKAQRISAATPPPARDKAVAGPVRMKAASGVAAAAARPAKETRPAKEKAVAGPVPTKAPGGVAAAAARPAKETRPAKEKAVAGPVPTRAREAFGGELRIARGSEHVALPRKSHRIVMAAPRIIIKKAAAGPVRMRMPSAIVVAPRAARETAVAGPVPKKAPSGGAATPPAGKSPPAKTPPSAKTPPAGKTPRPDKETTPAAGPVRTKAPPAAEAPASVDTGRTSAAPRATVPDRKPAPAAAPARARPRPAETGEMPPPPVAVIRRRPRAAEGGPEPGSRRRGVLGKDALAEPGATSTVRSAIEHVVDDLADMRARPKR